MDLLVDFLSLIYVGAVIRKSRFDRGVGERMEDDSPPQQLARALPAERANLLRILAP